MALLAVSGLVAVGVRALAQSPIGELHKAPPDSTSRAYDERLAALVEQRYPELNVGKLPGIPVVTVLFNYDGTVAGTHLEYVPEAVKTLTASEEQFARFGLSGERMQYMGVGRVRLRATPAVVIFGAEDSRDLDRGLVERLFPTALTQRAPPNDQLWILFDHGGRLLRVGDEPIAPENLRQTLEKRFPGIRTADMTTSTVFDLNNRPLEDLGHHPLQLDCVWLAEGSPTPTN